MQNSLAESISPQNLNGIAIEDYHITTEPFYVSTGNEISLFESAYRLKMPVLLIFMFTHGRCNCFARLLLLERTVKKH